MALTVSHVSQPAAHLICEWHSTDLSLTARMSVEFGADWLTHSNVSSLLPSVRLLGATEFATAKVTVYGF